MASFQLKPRKTVLLCIFFCAIFNASHFLVLERYGAGTLIFINSLRFLVAAFIPSRRWMWVSAFWVVHNLLVGSPVAMLMEACFLLSNYWGWRRFYANKN